jgi:hypothetical protein
VDILLLGFSLLEEGLPLLGEAEGGREGGREGKRKGGQSRETK